MRPYQTSIHNTPWGSTPYLMWMLFIRTLCTRTEREVALFTIHPTPWKLTFPSKADHFKKESVVFQPSFFRGTLLVFRGVKFGWHTFKGLWPQGRGVHQIYSWCVGVKTVHMQYIDVQSAISRMVHFDNICLYLYRCFIFDKINRWIYEPVFVFYGFAFGT